MMLSLRAFLLVFFTIALGTTCVAQDMRVSEIADKAVQIARQIENDQYQAKLLSNLAVIYVRNKQKKMGRELFAEALEMSSTNESLEEIAGDQAKVGFYDDALKTAEGIKGDDNDRLDMFFFSIAEWMACNSDLEIARKTVNKIEDGFWRSLSFADLAIACFKHGDKRNAESFLNQAVDGASDTRDSIFTIRMMAEHFASAGMKKRAQSLADRTFEMAKKKGDKWFHVMRAQAACGNVEGVQRVVAELKKQGDEISGEVLSINLAEAQAKAGRVDEALKTVKTLVHWEYYCVEAEIVAEAFLAAGRLDDALDVVETIDESENLVPLLKVAEAYHKRGDNNKAKELLREAREKMQTMEIEYYHYSLIGQAHGQTHQETELEDWAGSLEQPYAKAMALKGLANGRLDRRENNK